VGKQANRRPGGLRERQKLRPGKAWKHFSPWGASLNIWLAVPPPGRTKRSHQQARAGKRLTLVRERQAFAGKRLTFVGERQAFLGKRLTFVGERRKVFLACSPMGWP
jgi:hypothetical protein